MLPEAENSVKRRLRSILHSSIATVRDINGAHHGLHELLCSINRQNDRIATSAHVFRDLDEPSPVILLQIEKEDLPIRDDLFGV